jgi:DNA-binding GntR family transcriptional regulator
MQKETLKERVYRGIYEAVTNGEYRPNDILTENQMIEKFGVSKSPVREALVELCKDGVLINIPRMGYQVRAVTLKEIMDILKGLHNEGRTVILITHDNSCFNPGKYKYASDDRRKA